MSMTVTTRWA